MAEPERNPGSRDALGTLVEVPPEKATYQHITGTWASESELLVGGEDGPESARMLESRTSDHGNAESASGGRETRGIGGGSDGNDVIGRFFCRTDRMQTTVRGLSTGSQTVRQESHSVHPHRQGAAQGSQG